MPRQRAGGRCLQRGTRRWGLSLASLVAVEEAKLRDLHIEFATICSQLGSVVQDVDVSGLQHLPFRGAQDETKPVPSGVILAPLRDCKYFCV